MSIIYSKNRTKSPRIPKKTPNFIVLPPILLVLLLLAAF